MVLLTFHISKGKLILYPVSTMPKIRSLYVETSVNYCMVESRNTIRVMALLESFTSPNVKETSISFFRMSLGRVFYFNLKLSKDFS